MAYEMAYISYQADLNHAINYRRESVLIYQSDRWNGPRKRSMETIMPITPLSVKPATVTNIRVHSVGHDLKQNEIHFKKRTVNWKHKEYSNLSLHLCSGYVLKRW